MQLTEHFNLYEFSSKDGFSVPRHHHHNVQHLAEQLEIIRSVFDSPVLIRSGYRTTAHNKKIGGAVTSFHLEARAADIFIKGVNTFDLDYVIKLLIKYKRITPGGVRAYTDFVHYDTRGHIASW